jgi:hypothetical protein
MLKLTRSAGFCAAVLAALAVIALANAVRAQGIAGVDRSGELADGGRSTALSVQRFTLVGDGCPGRNSTAAFVEPRAGGVRLQIQFDRGNGRRFQVNGPNTAARTCTALVQLRNNTGRRLDVFLNRVIEGVRFVNGVDQGQLIVRSQFQLNDDVSEVRSSRLRNSPNVSATDVQLGGFDLLARVGTVLNVGAAVQLQLEGRNDAALRLEDLVLDLRFQVFRNGLEDPLLPGL